jgi:hypothetical protein
VLRYCAAISHFILPLVHAMPLPSPAVSRTRKHTRKISFEGYMRDDGLWDIEGHLVDTKPMDMPLAAGVRAAGEPIHEMWARLTVDRRMNVVEAVVATDAMPYPGACDRIAPDYAKLKGSNLLQGFRHTLKQHYGEVKGCTHMNELLAQMPTAAVQSFAGQRRDNQDDERKPFQLDRCHALATNTDTVLRFYPKWYREQAAPDQQPAGTAAATSR